VIFCKTPALLANACIYYCGASLNFQLWGASHHSQSFQVVSDNFSPSRHLTSVLHQQSKSLAFPTEIDYGANDDQRNTFCHNLSSKFQHELIFEMRLLKHYRKKAFKQRGSNWANGRHYRLAERATND